MASNPYYEAMVEAMGPTMRKQKEDVYNYLLQLGQRQGIAGAMRQAAKATEPYAEAFGKAASRSAAEAERMKQRESEFARQLEHQRELLRKRLEMFEKELGEKKREYDIGSRRQMFQRHR